ncbi:MAG TPA: glycosyltransferase [Bacteroidia bacterium]|nr:glycosyltransferase [Bacteroidia bacterium]
MAGNSTILYLSYDGITDPLGQSQVLPYIEGLSGEGYSFHLISFEKKDVYFKEHTALKLRMNKSGINWHPLFYTKKPQVISTVYDVYRMIRLAEKLIASHQIKLVHCRSYIAGLAGLHLKKKHHTLFLFDMRGFWADERVEGGIWNTSNPLYKSIYKYFKRKEKEMISSADAVISLTNAGKKVIDNWKYRTENQLPVAVIPCCADLNLFSASQVDKQEIASMKEELELNNAFPVISYLGAIGTWYLLNDMIRFFKLTLEKYPHALFLFITKEPEKVIETAARNAGIAKSRIRIKSAIRQQVPLLLSLSDVALFFIMPTFSKTASSPTKQGEIMGMGIPLICNSGVGDTDFVVNKYRSGISIDLSKKDSMDEAVSAIDRLIVLDKNTIRSGALDFYSLESGIAKYLAVYRSMVS